VHVPHRLRRGIPKEDISIQVASAYLQVLFNEELVKVANEQLALSKEMLEQKTAFYKNGKASQAEWYEAKARVAQDELSAVQAENNRRLSLLDLSQLLELPSPDDFAIVSPATDSIAGLKIQTSPAEVYAEAVLTKPSVKAAQYRLEGAEKSIRMAKGAYYPQLSFGAGISTNFYNVSGMENGNFGSQLRDNFSQYIGFSLSVPEEILIECTETRDQPKNKERALARLRTFIYDREHQKYLDDIASKRKTMVSTGDRSAKIRTYNYPQGRITDHRINYTVYNLSAYMDGDIEDCINHLIIAENAERMKESNL
jgi:outer membrane protein